MRAVIILKPGKEIALASRHPWLFSGAILQIKGDPSAGDLVDVFDCRGGFVCTGHYQADSIALKALSFTPVDSEEAYISQALQEAFQLRERLGLTDSRETTAYRLVHGEGDSLPGLIIDIYGDTGVVQFHSAGMFRNREAIGIALKSLYRDRLKALYQKKISSAKETLDGDNSYIFGDGEGGVVSEHGLNFKVDWIGGQKTGFYLDQRENRKKLCSYASGQNVLNAFCYTGGFSLSALAGGAKRVTSVDTSQAALNLLDDNLSLNPSLNAAAHSKICADCLHYLKELDENFNLVVLDPPAFIKHRGALKGGIKGYKAINTHAMQHIEEGGIIFTFSCSQLLSRNDLREVLVASAIDAGKRLRIIEQLSQSPCHPVNAFHPEGDYLKGFIVEVRS